MRPATTAALRLLAIAALGALAGTTLASPASPAFAGLTVVDAAGDPVAGAAVEVRTAPDGDDLLAQIAAPIQTAETRADGKADLNLPAVTTLITVDHPDHAPWIAEVAPEDHLSRVRLAPGRTLAGAVVASAPPSSKSRDADHHAPAPKEGTVCSSWRDEQPRWGFAKTWRRCAQLTDDGTFEVAGLPPADEPDHPIELSVQAPGFLPLHREIDTDALFEPLRLELRRGVLIPGRVEGSAGEPLRGAIVRDAGDSAEASSHPDGAFEIAVDSLPATLIAVAPGYRSARVRIPENRPNSERLTIALTPAERITGVVLGEDATPPPEPRLAWELHAEGRRESGRFEVDSDDGSFGFDLPRPGTYLLTLEAEGYRDEPLPELRVDPGAVIDLGVIELSRGGGVRGTVVDSESGDGLPGVSISLLPTGPTLLRAAEKKPPTTVTDDDGRFALFGVEGGRYELRARHDRYATHVAPVTLHRDEAETLGPIALDLGASVRIRLVDRTGEPRSGLALRFRDRGAEVLLPVAEGLSDVEGWVEGITLAAGDYRAEVTGERLLLAQELEVAAGEDEIELELTVGGVDLTGRVLRGGEPVAGGTLSLTSALDPGNTRGKLTLRTADGRSASYGMTETGVSAVVSPSGAFRVPDAPAGVLLATWSGRGTSAQRELLVPDMPRADVEIELGGLPLTGRVVTTDGAPIPRADIVVTDASGRVVGQARTGPGGGFTMPDLARDRYSLEASAQGYSSVTRTEVPVTEGSPPLVLTMERGGDGSLDVVLTRDDGSPLAGDLISLLDRSGRVVRSLVADGRGHRRFDALPSGEYFVVWTDALAGVGHSPAIRVEGASGEPGSGGGEATIWSQTLPEGGALVVACERPECAGAPIQLLTVQSAAGLPLDWALPGLSAGLRLSANGEVALGWLAPGTYQVSVWAAGHRWEVPVRALSGTSARVVVD